MGLCPRDVHLYSNDEEASWATRFQLSCSRARQTGFAAKHGTLRRELIVEAFSPDGSCRFFGQLQECQVSPWLALSESACTFGRPQTRYKANAFASDSPAKLAHNLHCSAPASGRSAGQTQGVLPFLSLIATMLLGLAHSLLFLCRLQRAIPHLSSSHCCVHLCWDLEPVRCLSLLTYLGRQDFRFLFFGCCQPSATAGT